MELEAPEHAGVFEDLPALRFFEDPPDFVPSNHC